MAQNATVIALAGNPNCGKSSLFNFITGARQHVGNYPGVTVEKKEGTVRVDDVMVTFVDLPGTYSLNPFSLEENIAMHEIISDRISGIIVVVDTTKLGRNLYLVSQIIETGKPVMLALNMYDEFEGMGSRLDIAHLSDILGVPCVKTVGNRGKGVTELISTALKAVHGETPAVGKIFHYSHEMEHSIERVVSIIDGKVPHNLRWTAVNFLNYNRAFARKSARINLSDQDFQEIENIRENLEKIEGRDINSIVTAGRYGFASGVTAECLEEQIQATETLSDKIDSVITHRWIGIPIFFLVLWIMFQATFRLGETPMGWIEHFFRLLEDLATSIIPDNLFRSIIVDGIFAGVGGVLVFLPNILILFFFISILEDTGYMARAAFIMDRVMHAVGLHGKSFIPMLVGFGCSVPAIMATRTLENKRDRYVTMFIIPFMSCGARLPVYMLIAGAFFSPNNAGNVIFSIYLVGIFLAFIIAKILSLVQTSSTSFVMELPPYRIPTLRSVILHIWERAWLYLKKAGTIILTFSVIMWFLMSFPQSPVTVDVGDNHPVAVETHDLSQTYAGKFGKLIEPALRPLGFDWKIGIALFAGFSAKEVVVSTLATIYAIEPGEGDDIPKWNLKSALRNDPLLNPLTGYALMLFILIYVPCIAVLSVLKRETGGWKWVFIMIAYTTSLAWLVTFTFITVAKIVL